MLLICLEIVSKRNNIFLFFFVLSCREHKENKIINNIH